MPFACLIVNPKAGGNSAFASRLDEMTRVLNFHGFAAQAIETTSAPHSARDLARRASDAADLVIACGGDGTVHGVVQGVANTRACLGVLPFGTANALARNLGLPLDPVAALQRLLQFKTTEIPLGVARNSTGNGIEERWFTVMAGAGPDGRLIHEMKLSAKPKTGRVTYYAQAGRLFATRRFRPFCVEYRITGSSTWERRTVVAMMASRVPDLGGLFRGLTSHSRLHHPHLLAQLVTGPAHLAFPAWFAFGKTGLGNRNPWATSVNVEELICTPLDNRSETFSQVDGEAFGAIPMSLGIVNNALRMLMP